MPDNAAGGNNSKREIPQSYCNEYKCENNMNYLFLFLTIPGYLLLVALWKTRKRLQMTNQLTTATSVGINGGLGVIAATIELFQAHFISSLGVENSHSYSLLLLLVLVLLLYYLFILRSTDTDNNNS